MSKDKELEVADPKEAEVDLMVKLVDLTISCKTKAYLNGKVKIKAKPSGKVVTPLEVDTIPIEEEVILTLEVDFMVNVINVVVKLIDPLNVKVMVIILVEML